MGDVDEHEERMELFHARMADIAPGGVDPLILEEITAPDYFADANGEPTQYTEAEIERMIEALESTGRYDVVGRRW